MIYVGIDPGLTGAVAFLDANGHLLRVVDAPTIVVKKSGGGNRTAYIEAEMARILEITETSTSSPEVRVIIESAHARPKQGVTSTFSTGFGMGLWIGILAALRLPHVRVEPRVWKKAYGLGPDKAQSIVVAQRLFPTAPLARKKDHGRAEAILLADYLRKK